MAEDVLVDVVCQLAWHELLQDRLQGCCDEEQLERINEELALELQ